MSITLKVVKAKLLEELRLDIYLKESFKKDSFGSNSQYELGREDTTRNHLVLLGYDKDKLMTVEDIDELLGVGR